jgi:hypothetical protein
LFDLTIIGFKNIPKDNHGDSVGVTLVCYQWAQLSVLRIYFKDDHGIPVRNTVLGIVVPKCYYETIVGFKVIA